MHPATPDSSLLGTVFISSVASDKMRMAARRTKLAKLLGEQGWDMVNIDGSKALSILEEGAPDSARKTLSLLNIEREVIRPSSAFMFLPVPRFTELTLHEKSALFEQFFLAASLAVGIQTKDPFMMTNPSNTKGSPHKPVVILNPRHDHSDPHIVKQLNSWGPFRKLFDHLHILGTVRQNFHHIYSPVHTLRRAVAELKKETHIVKPSIDLHQHHLAAEIELIRQGIELKEADKHLNTGRHKPAFNLCVFCSASTSRKDLLESAYSLGRMLAEKGWGLVTGAGKTGMMGEVVRGTVEVVHATGATKGWTGGCNIPRIFDLEGMPEYMDALWVTDDIYTRMEKMIDESEAFAIMPGGMGTVQEFMALLLLKHRELASDKTNKDIMKNKPIYVVNQQVECNGKTIGFWDPLVTLARDFGFTADFEVVEDVHQLMAKLQRNKQPRGYQR